MKNKISENTELTLNIKTIVIIIASVAAVSAGYLTIKKDIDIAKENSKKITTPYEFDKAVDRLLTKVEFNISQEAVKQIVRETQEKMHAGHTTMYQMLEEKFRESIKENRREIMQSIKESKIEIIQVIKEKK
jgi:hypothetical protein